MHSRQLVAFVPFTRPLPLSPSVEPLRGLFAGGGVGSLVLSLGAGGAGPARSMALNSVNAVVSNPNEGEERRSKRRRVAWRRGGRLVAPKRLG